jgi:hypothetical protein
MKQAVMCLESFAVMGLVGTGLTGGAYHLFREGGWLEMAGASLWAFIENSPMMALVAVLSAVVITWLWRRSKQYERQNGTAATGAFYVMLAAGAYFAGHLVMSGGL